MIFDRSAQDFGQYGMPCIETLYDIDGDALTATDGVLTTQEINRRARLNASDLNRIESWTAYLNEQLHTRGYTAPITTRAPWRYGEYPTPTEFARIRTNIDALHTAFFAVPEWRELVLQTRADGRETIDYTQVNAQEWDLRQIYDWLLLTVQAMYRYSGTFYSGMVIF